MNWSRKTLVFTNAPSPIERTPTGSEIGIDRGVTHTLTTSNGEFFDIPKQDPTKYKSLQKKLSRQKDKNSNRRKKTLQEMKKVSSYEARKKEHWIHEVTKTLIVDNDLIVLEDLKVKNMTKKGRGKRGLNRAILLNNWSKFKDILQYKADLAGVRVEFVNPAYTSQRCNKCGHTAKENRESQSVFSCIECGHTANADINAAKNILDRATGQSVVLGRGGEVRPDSSGTSYEASTAALAGETKALPNNQQSSSLS